MDLQVWLHLFNALLMIGLPVGLAIFLTQKFHLGWRLWAIGAATFILSQVGHIPFNSVITPLFNQPGFSTLPAVWQMILTAIFLGLSAGMFEELARYAMYRWWAKDARSWRTGLLAGAGHGGIEAIVFGGLALYAFFQLLALRGADLTGMFPANQLALATSQVNGYWSMPWYDSLLGALERGLTIPCHLAMSLLVLQTFIRKQGYWLWLAVLYHALLDFAAVIGIQTLGAYWTEALVAVFTVISLGIIFALRRPEPVVEPEGVNAAPLPAFMPRPMEETEENLDNSKYAG